MAAVVTDVQKTLDEVMSISGALGVALVDLNSGRVLWFNQLVRASGDLREADKAKETLDSLLTEFPVAK